MMMRGEKGVMSDVLMAQDNDVNDRIHSVCAQCVHSGAHI